MWNREIAEKFWAKRPATYTRRESTMRYYVMNREDATYFEKQDGTRVWHVDESGAELSKRLGDFAVVVALDERNFNESLNCYLCGEFVGQVAFDDRGIVFS